MFLTDPLACQTYIRLLSRYTSLADKNDLADMMPVVSSLPELHSGRQCNNEGSKAFYRARVRRGRHALKAQGQHERFDDSGAHAVTTVAREKKIVVEIAISSDNEKERALNKASCFRLLLPQ